MERRMAAREAGHVGFPPLGPSAAHCGHDQTWDSVAFARFGAAQPPSSYASLAPMTGAVLSP